MCWRKQKQDSIVETQERCHYKTAEECPYKREKECKFSKENCALQREREERKRRHRNIKKLVLMVVFSSVAILVFFGIRMYLNSSCPNTSYWKELLTAFIGGAFSVLAASILAIIIDIPSWLKDYDEHFARILSSNSYLKTLDEKSLVQLRQDITSQIHKTTTQKMGTGLVRMDESICALFKKPYYERYMHSVRCKKTDDSTITKTHVVEYKLINPNAGYEEAVESIRISNLIQKRNNDDKGISNFEFSYSIDNQEECKLSNDYGMFATPLDKKIEFYDTKVCLVYKPDNDVERKAGVELRFKECVHIKYSYTIVINAADRCFTKRLQHPAELFILNYSCDDDDIQLHGQLMGTDLKQSNFSIHYHDENSMTLVSYDWLLPDNGAIVVMLDKKKEKDERKIE